MQTDKGRSNCPVMIPMNFNNDKMARYPLKYSNVTHLLTEIKSCVIKIETHTIYRKSYLTLEIK